MERRPERGMWAGLWQAPTLEGAKRLNKIYRKQAADRVDRAVETAKRKVLREVQSE